MASYFTDEDVRILEKTARVREMTIDALTKDQMPSRPSDVMALVSVIESLDKTILTKAKLKIEDTASKSNEETQTMMRELLLNLHRTGIKAVGAPATLTLPEDIEYTILPAEMVKDIDQVSIKDF